MTPRQPARRGTTGRRSEIHGLRGIAIALVVAYHLWGFGRVSGGVDVFLMISAYLLAGSMLRKGSDFSYPSYLIGRFRRLVPQAAVVILATLLAGYLVLPPTRWDVLLRQALTSVTYVQNWALIDAVTDYGAGDHIASSPLQHFWSLSVQGQIFILWPLVLGVALLLRRLLRRSLRIWLALLFAVITVVSFAYASVTIERSASAAYFDTFARAWEFSLASLIALAPTPRLPSAVGRVLGWVGLIGIAVGGLVVGRGTFPGWVALWPLLAATLVIWFAAGESRWNVGHWLGTRPVAWIADRAYGLYLWHWPVFICYLGYRHQNAVGIGGSVGVITVSLLLADVSTRLIERRFNTAVVPGGKGAIALIVGFAIIVFTVVHSGTWWLTRQADTVAGQNPDLRPGARAIIPGQEVPGSIAGAPLTPSGTAISSDNPPDLPACRPQTSPMPPDCFEYVPPEPPTRTVALVGDSHSQQYLDVLLPMARAENWHLVSMIRGYCRFTMSPGIEPWCAAHNQGVAAYLQANPPDLIVTVASRAPAVGTDETLVQDHLATMRPFLDAGVQIINIRDNPRWTYNMPECVQRRGPDSPQCAAPLADKLAAESPLIELEQVPGMSVVDLTGYLCPNDRCPGVIGNVYVYRDDNHLSATYVRTLQDRFEYYWWANVVR